MLKIKNTRVETRADADEWDKQASHWMVSITCNKVKRSFSYSMGSAIEGEPQLIGVIYSIVLDSSAVHQTFEDWCQNIDQDTDSIRAKKTFNACLKNAAKLVDLLGGEEVRQALECEMDY